MCKRLAGICVLSVRSAGSSASAPVVTSMMLVASLAVCSMSAARPAWAQGGASAPAAPAACPRPSKVAAPTDAQRREARQLAARAQQASIVDDNQTARELFRRAVQLDPSDASTVYALARAHDAAHAPREAIAQYCRFLTLSPGAPEADDVRERVAALATTIAAAKRGDKAATDVADAVPSAASSATTENSVTAKSPALVTAPSASSAPTPPVTQRVGVAPAPPAGDDIFLIATVVPGLGQYATHRPLFGAAVTTVAAAALYYAFHQESEPVTAGRTSGGRSVVLTQTTRPHLATGLTLAVGVSVLSAIEAERYARGGDRRRSSR